MSANTVETAATDAPAAQDHVESVTDALKNTYLDQKVDNSGDDAAHAASAAEGRRLYIGNLAYSTTEEQLKEFFEGFSIESTSIPTNPRTGRTVGYAFVDLTTKEEAERAIAELSGKEVLERKVSVQFARKPGSSTAKKGSVNGSGDEQAQQQQQDRPRKGRGGFRYRGRGRFRGGYRARNANRENGHANGASDGESGDNSEGAPTNAQVLTESTNVVTAESELTRVVTPASGADETNTNNNAAGGFKPRRKRGPPENGVPSTIKVMVANLPYELSEEKLKELFAEYQPEAAKIALRPIPRQMVKKLEARGEPRKGRGFGFVTLANEEMQKKAVEEMNGKVVDGREIAVKVAIDSPKPEGEGEQQEEEKKVEDAAEEAKDAGKPESKQDDA
ncbi:hypothetical protein RUND412_006380 [Rhizina undulata]